jgi:hypothetical protein
MYLITDSYGTRQVAWRWATALQWLACTAREGGAIRNRFTLGVIARRHQGV